MIGARWCSQCDWKGYVPQQHDVVIAAHLVEGPAKVGGGILFIAASIFLLGAGEAERRIEKPLTVRIIASAADDRADRLLDIIGYWDLRQPANQDRHHGFVMSAHQGSANW